ncbi:MAG: VCBS repeat-containing protein [Planctomycetota bacterium]|nr:MAG: VCBS repeat-containing protein [Planctomycetota bacterium]
MLIALLLSAAQGPVPYSTQASWQSYSSGVTTGGEFADLDRDGDQDFVVANGNDILRQRVEVYYNDGAGNFPQQPQWQSGDVDYHGHLAAGDVDGDGWPDLAVSVFLGPQGFGDKGHVKLYRNNAGTLSSTPVWRSADEFFSFSCDLGDADGDGDLDLAVATGEPYFDPPDHNRIYYNSNGTLETTPSWLSSTVDHCLDVSFGDADGDGDLDLALCTAAGPMRVFYQGLGGMSTSPGWTATDNNSQNGNTCTFGDVDADGFLDLAVTDNDQLPGGNGRYKIYRSNGGSLATTPFWSDFAGQVSAVAFADLHLDGYPDLAGGVWFAGTDIYLNDNGGFGTAPNWQSSSNSTVEAITFADVDGNGIQQSTETLPGDGVRRTFYLAKAPVHELLEARADGVLLAAADYAFDAADGWLALDRAPATLVVRYRWSESLDMGVTNWDQSIGNLVFRRKPLIEVDLTPTGPTTLQRGQALQFNAARTSTVNRSESYALVFKVRPAAGGPTRPIASYPGVLAAFQTVSGPYAFQVPLNTPLRLNGQYLLIGSAVRDASMTLGSDSLPFTLQ